jgi:hypothetical protein
MRSNAVEQTGVCAMASSEAMASHAGNWQCTALADASIMAGRCNDGISRGQNVKRKPKASATIVQSNGQIGKPEQQTTSLRNEVKEALLSVLRDSEASAASKASAGRTLLEYFSDDKSATKSKRGAELSASELDAAIAELE